MADVKIDAPLTVAIMAGKHSVMDQAANRVKTQVVAAASVHRKSGAFIDSIKIKKVPGRSGRGTLVTDRLVYSDDKAVGKIEFGRKASDDPNDTRRVPGQNNFGRAYAALGRGK